VVLLTSVYVIAQAQKPDSIMRVGGEVTAVDGTAGNVTVTTTSGPRMTVRNCIRGLSPALGYYGIIDDSL
jgi:hypothetical protein